MLFSSNWRAHSPAKKIKSIELLTALSSYRVRARNIRAHSASTVIGNKMIITGG